MGRRKKPGTPGKSTIPPKIVSSVTKRLWDEFTKREYHLDHHLFIIPQQCYLYVEVKRKEFGSVEPQPPITLSSTTHIPLGRLKFMGTSGRWEFQPYSWSDEYWDDRETETGTPEDLMLSMVVRPARLREIHDGAAAVRPMMCPMALARRTSGRKGRPMGARCVPICPLSPPEGDNTLNSFRE